MDGKAAEEAWRQHRAEVQALTGWMNGARLADERAWLSPAERERLESEKAAWPPMSRELREHTRRFRQEHPEAFRQWCLSEIRDAQSEDYAVRVRATMAGHREDPVFSYATRP